MNFKARANIEIGFPDLPSTAYLESLSHLKGMVDLERVVVISMGVVVVFSKPGEKWLIPARVTPGRPEDLRHA